MRIKSEFPNYKLSKEERMVVGDFERNSGFDLSYTDLVVDRRSFIDCIKKNHQWLGAWVNDVVKGNEKELRKLSYFLKTVLK